MQKSWLWMAAALAAVATPAGAQSLGDARAFVTGLYRAYQASPETDYLGSRAASVFSPRLIALIRRDERAANGEVGALDGDPICDCQDPDGIRLVGLQISSAGPGRALARARVRYAGDRAETITLELVSVRGRWRIDDVRTPDTASLARMLREHPGG